MEPEYQIAAFQALRKFGQRAWIMLDEDSTIIGHNEAFEAISGHDDYELIGQNIAVILGEVSTFHSAKLIGRFGPKRPVKMKCKDGRVITVKVAPTIALATKSPSWLGFIQEVKGDNQ